MFGGHRLQHALACCVESAPLHDSPVAGVLSVPKPRTASSFVASNPSSFRFKFLKFLKLPFVSNSSDGPAEDEADKKADTQEAKDDAQVGAAVEKHPEKKVENAKAPPVEEKVTEAGDVHEKYLVDSSGKRLDDRFAGFTPEVTQYFQDLQDSITDKQAKWRDGLINLDAGYTGVSGAHVARMNTWNGNKDKLQRQCEQLRDAVDRLNESKELCAKMQDEELPELFKIKVKDPKRFRRFGMPQGCVKMNLETGHVEPDKCECIAGTEKEGCIDAVGLTGNTLSCTHILNEQFPNMPLASFFTEGGACRVSGRVESKDAWSEEIIPKSVFGGLLGTNQVKSAAMGEMSLAVCALPQFSAELFQRMAAPPKEYSLSRSAVAAHDFL